MKFEIEARVRRPAGFRLEARFACETGALGLVGPSGSGKSTLLDCIAGIEPGASVVLDGADYSRVPLARREIGHVSQDALLFPHLSVRQNLLYSPRAQSFEKAVEVLRIGHLLDRMPRHLSGGERRRAALARALACRPKLLLLDEPFAGLDETRRREAMSLLVEVRQAFRTPMVLVSHSIDEVIGLTDWSLRLEEGKIAEAGPSISLLRGSGSRIDNYLAGEICGPGRVRAGGVELAALIPAGASAGARVACYAHDILIATQEPRSLSARNILPVSIASAVPVGDLYLLEVEPPRLRVLLTREAVASLGLQPGRSVFAIIKATSLAYLGPQ